MKKLTTLLLLTLSVFCLGQSLEASNKPFKILEDFVSYTAMDSFFILLKDYQKKEDDFSEHLFFYNKIEDDYIKQSMKIILTKYAIRLFVSYMKIVDLAERHKNLAKTLTYKKWQLDSYQLMVFIKDSIFTEPSTEL